MVGIIIFILGLLIGPFLNVCIYKIPKEESIAYPPSHCYSCGKRLRSLELIPVLSYIFLRGKCKGCGSRVSLRYPMIEVLTAIIFLLLYREMGLRISLYFHILLASILICVAFIDLDYQIIPDVLVLLGFGAGLLYKIVAFLYKWPSVGFLDGIYGLLLGGGFCLLIAILSNGGMGGGDIKLMAMLGFWFGLRSIIFIALLAFIVGSIVSVALLLTSIKTRKDFIPFGPFIVASTYIALLFQQGLMQWYMELVMQKL